MVAAFGAPCPERVPAERGCAVLPVDPAECVAASIEASPAGGRNAGGAPAPVVAGTAIVGTNALVTTSTSITRRAQHLEVRAVGMPCLPVLSRTAIALPHRHPNRLAAPHTSGSLRRDEDITTICTGCTRREQCRVDQRSAARARLFFARGICARKRLQLHTKVDKGKTAIRVMFPEIGRASC